MRIVIELKKDAIPAVVQNNLYKKTALQTTFSGNMLALMNNGTLPQRITLKDALSTFIDFRCVYILFTMSIVFDGNACDIYIYCGTCMYIYILFYLQCYYCCCYYYYLLLLVLLL